MDSKELIMINIRTNYHWRDLISGYELTDVEREEFDYLDEDDLLDHQFIRYQNWVYDLGEFMRCPEPQEACSTHANTFENWHGYQSDSFFSGVVIRYSDDCEQIQVGTYTS
jgi:hypothetical protein